MRREGVKGRALLLLALLSCALAAGAFAQTRKGARTPSADAEFGPIVRAYLSYLRDQQEVVDDRVSRREIDRGYYTHNSNRIRALREMALRIARETENDFLPELEAVTQEEFDQLFDAPLPAPSALRVGETLEYKFRFLGAVSVRATKFYLFARLDPYEQSELRQKGEAERRTQAQTPAQTPAVGGDASPDAASRPRRVQPPL